MIKVLRAMLVVTAIAGLTACAPVTETIKLDPQAVKREQQIQRNLARKYPKKKISTKFKSNAHYEQRLSRVATRIQKSGASFCKNPKKCHFEVLLHNGKELNAWTDGKNIYFTRTILEFLDGDTELALIMSHEYAHAIQGHVKKQIGNRILGGILDAAAATQGVNTQGMFGSMSQQAYSQGFENEADYIGLYIMAKAGYNTKGAHNLWRKFAIQSPTGINKSYFASHPSHAERYLRMEKTHQEIIDKRQSGKTLSPTTKKELKMHRKNKQNLGLQ